LTGAYKAEPLMNRIKNKAKERGVWIFLIFMEFPFDEKSRKFISKIYTWRSGWQFKKVK
jgi:hypothetical protein